VSQDPRSAAPSAVSARHGHGCGFVWRLRCNDFVVCSQPYKDMEISLDALAVLKWHWHAPLLLRSFYRDTEIINSNCSYELSLKLFRGSSMRYFDEGASFSFVSVVAVKIVRITNFGY